MQSIFEKPIDIFNTPRVRPLICWYVATLTIGHEKRPGALRCSFKNTLNIDGHTVFQLIFFQLRPTPHRQESKSLHPSFLLREYCAHQIAPDSKRYLSEDVAA